MSRASELGKGFDPQYKKPRRLLYEKTDRADAATPEEQVEEVHQSLNNARKVQAKAEWLFKKMQQLAIKKRVPVAEDARDVRAAVRRKRPLTNGEYIELKLYLETLEYLNRRQEAVDENILSDLPRDANSAAKKMETHIVSESESIDWASAAYIVNQVFLLLIQKLLQKGNDNIDAQLQTGPKQPAGAETAAVTIAVAISIVVQLVITNFLQEEIEANTNQQPGAETLDPIAVNGAMAEAQTILDGMPAYLLAKKAQNPGDYRLISDYVDGFLADVKEPGWEEWLFLTDIFDAKQDASAVISVLETNSPVLERDLGSEQEEAAQDDDDLSVTLFGRKVAVKDLDFSAAIGPGTTVGQEFAQGDKFTPGQRSLTRNVSGPDEAPISAAAGLIPSGSASVPEVLPGFGHTFSLGGGMTGGQRQVLPTKIKDVLDSQIDGLNDIVNNVATVLSWRETQDLICCVVRWIGRIDLDSIKMLRILLNSALGSTSFDLDASFSGAINQSFTLGRQAAVRMLWEIVEGYDQLVDRIWSQIAEVEGMEEAFACTPLDEIMHYIAGWARGYLDMAVNFVLKYADMNYQRSQKFGLKLDAAAHMKKMRWYLSLIDMVLAAVDKGELCQPDQSEDIDETDVTAAAEAVAAGLPSTLALPEPDPNDPYRSFATGPLTLSNGIVLAPRRESQDPVTGATTKIDHEECRKKLAGSELQKFTSFLGRLNELS